MDNSSEANLAELLTLRKVVDKFGNVYYNNKDGHLHRIHGPALIWDNGHSEWWENGIRVRDKFGGTTDAW